MSASRHLVDPELYGLLETFPTLQLSDAVLPLMRAAPPRKFDLGPAGATALSSRRSIPGPEGALEVMVSVHQPASAPSPGSARGVILHIHGGGYIAGSAESNAPAHRALVETLDGLVAQEAADA